MAANLNDIESPTLSRFFQYYLEKRRGRDFPARADIDPCDFPYALGDITLIDVRYDPLKFFFRLDGSRHVERFGFDMTGRSLDEFPYPEMRQAIFDSYRDVIDHREPRRYFRDLESSGRWFRYETLLLPLSSDGTTIDMIISAISFHDLKIPIAAERVTSSQSSSAPGTAGRAGS
ncbi:MAG TPA: PAS domain-containing protein [Candidatus Binatia bacterium]|nr:PAS domain-containing protein [Candidatus Binatia bacterium]